MAAIDVLMPMRDAAPWVGAAWRSLERQTFRDWRLLAVDDGSRDGTVGVLETAARGDPRLWVVEAPREGIAATLNRGLAVVTARIVARMDADDLAHPRRLDALWEALDTAPELSVAASRARLFPRAAVTPTMEAYLRWQNGLLTHRQIRLERYVECTVTHASAAFRAAALVEAGGWWEGDGPEDLDLFLRLHARGARFCKLPRILYFWRERPGRETRTSRRLTIEAFRGVKARHLASELRGRGITDVTLFGTGESLCRWTEALTARGVEVAAQEYRARGPVPRFHGFALFCFGQPAPRARLRLALGSMEEGERYLFVA